MQPRSALRLVAAMMVASLLDSDAVSPGSGGRWVLLCPVPALRLLTAAGPGPTRALRPDDRHWNHYDGPSVWPGARNARALAGRPACIHWPGGARIANHHDAVTLAPFFFLWEGFFHQCQFLSTLRTVHNPDSSDTVRIGMIPHQFKKNLSRDF